MIIFPGEFSIGSKHLGRLGEGPLIQRCFYVLGELSDEIFGEGGQTLGVIGGSMTFGASTERRHFELMPRLMIGRLHVAADALLLNAGMCRSQRSGATLWEFTDRSEQEIVLQGCMGWFFGHGIRSSAIVVALSADVDGRIVIGLEVSCGVVIRQGRERFANLIRIDRT